MRTRPLIRVGIWAASLLSLSIGTGGCEPVGAGGTTGQGGGAGEAGAGGAAGQGGAGGAAGQGGAGGAAGQGGA
ncbi:MAG TPA: hypothetical protein PK156_48080, partial [Polyangium sp.]|nr:hypothetical protein [Polyangium sp.]